MVGLVAAVAAGFLAAQGEQWWGLAAFAVVLALTWIGGAAYFRSAERRHDRELEQHWQALATSRGWRFEREYEPVEESLRTMLLGQGAYVRSEGTPYRLRGSDRAAESAPGTPTRRRVEVHLCLVRPPRMLLWGELPQRCTLIVLQTHQTVPAMGFGTHGRLFNERPEPLRDVPHERDRHTGYWIAGPAGEADRVREAFAPAIARTGRQQLRMVADGPRLGLVVHRELTTAEISDWVVVLHQVADNLGQDPAAGSWNGEDSTPVR